MNPNWFKSMRCSAKVVVLGCFVVNLLSDDIPFTDLIPRLIDIIAHFHHRWPILSFWCRYRLNNDLVSFCLQCRMGSLLVKLWSLYTPFSDFVFRLITIVIHFRHRWPNVSFWCRERTERRIGMRWEWVFGEGWGSISTPIKSEPKLKITQKTKGKMKISKTHHNGQHQPLKFRPVNAIRVKPASPFQK